MVGPKLGEWFRCFDTEINNLRAALEWSVSGGNVEDGLRLAHVLWRYWSLAGYLAEGLAWLERLIARSTGAAAELRAQALRGAGALAGYQGDLVRAAAWFEACLGLYRELEKPRELAATLNDLGMLATDAGRFERAEAFYVEGLAQCRALQDRQGTALLLYNLGRLAGYQGQPERARDLCLESLALGEALGDKRLQAYAQYGLGMAAYGLDEFEPAEAHYLKSLALKQALGDRQTLIWSLEGLATVFEARGQLEQAAQLSRGLEAWSEEAGLSLPAPHITAHEQLTARLRARLGEAAFSQAWAEGRRMSLDQLAALALAAANSDWSP
jgi:tetratricopeptide (TPR) repeat protein